MTDTPATGSVLTLAMLEECAAKVRAIGPVPRFYETPFAPPTGGLLIDGVLYVSPSTMKEFEGKTP